MVMIEEVLVRCGVARPDLEIWIDRVWIRPTRVENDWFFREEDIARIELVSDLVHDMNLSTDAVDVILPLVDQVYGLRRSLRSMTHAIGDLPADSRRQILERLSGNITK